MSYTAHVWTEDETISPARLNVMENGIAAGGDVYDAYDFVIRYDGNQNTYTAIKGTYSDLSSRISQGEVIHGLFEELYISGTWVTTYITSSMCVAWNPSSNCIGIDAFCGGHNYTIAWDSNGVYYND